MNRQEPSNSNQSANSVPQNGNQVAVAGAITRNVDPLPPIFELDTICWDKIFDWMSLRDLIAFAETCKTFQWIAGQYFQWQYAAIPAFPSVDNLHLREFRYNTKVFSEHVTKIRFWMADPRSIFYVEPNCKKVKELHLRNDEWSFEDLNAFKSILSKVEILRLYNYEDKFDRDVCEQISGFCLNLKRLVIRGRVPSFIWPLRNQPTLEHLDLHLVSDQFANDELKTFLEVNPNVRGLVIHAKLLWSYRNSILNANVQLDNLAIRINRFDEMNGFVDFLNDLYQHRQFYKRLHLELDKYNHYLTPDQLLALHGLTTLYTYSDDNTNYPALNDIKEFGTYENICSDGRHNSSRAGALASRFINLEHLRIFRADFDAILPFIRHSTKLKSIMIRDFKGETVNISALNKERKALAVRNKVTIYVDEDTYLATKWASTDTKYDWVELERHDSYVTERPHEFWKDFQQFGTL